MADPQIQTCICRRRHVAEDRWRLGKGGAIILPPAWEPDHVLSGSLRQLAELSGEVVPHSNVVKSFQFYSARQHADQSSRCASNAGRRRRTIDPRFRASTTISLLARAGREGPWPKTRDRECKGQCIYKTPLAPHRLTGLQKKSASPTRRKGAIITGE